MPPDTKFTKGDWIRVIVSLAFIFLICLGIFLIYRTIETEEQRRIEEERQARLAMITPTPTPLLKPETAEQLSDEEYIYQYAKQRYAARDFDSALEHFLKNPEYKDSLDCAKEIIARRDVLGYYDYESSATPRGLAFEIDDSGYRFADDANMY